jgi:hypothetical protein
MSLQDPNQPPFSPMDWGFDRPTNVDMAGNYDGSKPGLGKIYKNSAVATGWPSEEPIITPQKLKEIFLFGIPLVSAIKDPLTNRPAIMTDPLLKTFIEEAIALAEAESKIDIMPTQYVEVQAFDRCQYDSFGFMLLRHRPVHSLESITVTASNEMSVFSIPLDWVSTQQLHLGQLNLIPLTIATKGGAVVPLTSSPGGATFLSVMGNKPWIPSFFEIRYTGGFPEGTVPRIINQYLGVVASMEVLSSLAATYARSNSTSLSIDGLSQSVGTPGSDIFTVRLTQLAEKRRWLLGRIQAAMGMSFFSDNV